MKLTHGWLRCKSLSIGPDRAGLGRDKLDNMVAMV